MPERPPEFERAVAALRAGRLDEAEAACRRLLDDAGEQPGVLRLMAQIAAARGDQAGACRVLERALALAPGSPDLGLDLAEQLAVAGRGEQALEAVGQALANAPQAAYAHNRGGSLLARLGQPRAAEAAFRRALQLDARLTAARYNLGLLLAMAGDHPAAAELLGQACEDEPARPEPWLHFGGVLNALGRYEEAEAALQRHLGLAPNSVHGRIWLGAAQQFLGQFEAAEQSYRQALALAPDAVDAHANLGRLLQAQGRPAEAEVSLRAALRLAPGHRQARAGLAALLDQRGDYEQALSLARDPDGTMPPETAAIGARAQRHLGLLAAAGQTLETALATPGLPAEAEVQLRFSLGQVRDEAGDFAAAADLFREANRRQQARFGAAAAESDLAQFARSVDRIAAAFDAARLAAAPRSGEQSERPLFIVGLPRAGKSLAEQILCSHPDVHGAGELLGVPNAADALGGALGGWPEGVSGVTAEQLGTAAAGYLAELDRAAAAASRVTDTMPFNFLHLGLIELLFPNARVVHCVRHPADLALRIYAKNFAGRSLAFASDVGHIARYLLDYRRLMSHWRETLRRPVHELHYETLVREPAAATRALLDFAGLPWDERCLRFFEPGIATSASDTPVRRPLADREIGAWRAYEKLLAPAIDTLADEDFWHEPA